MPMLAESMPCDRLTSWMDAQALGSGPVEDTELLSGGTQNVVARFRRGARQFVLRRPPPVLRANSNETMLREATVLRALDGTAVAHPALIAVCRDPAILGATFYLMEPVQGFNATHGLPSLHRSDPKIRYRMGLALVEAIAALGSIDHVEVGLQRFGKPEGFLQRQTKRWRAQLASYTEHGEWPGPGFLPHLAAVDCWLDDHLPASSFRAGIIHGDFHIGNVLYDLHNGEIAAVVDWELATIGDPLLDLAWLVATWPDNDGSLPNPDIAVRPQDGFPTWQQLIRHYGTLSSRDLSAISWYVVLACYKLGIILEGTYARACAGKAPQATGEKLHATAVRLFERAGRWISSDPPI
jgi:aminoglycoside phosphotransferase (APT) family kinase protein